MPNDFDVEAILKLIIKRKTISPTNQTYPQFRHSGFLLSRALIKNSIRAKGSLANVARGT